MSRQQQRASYKNMGRSQVYVEGNTVRKFDTLPQMQQQEESRREQQRRVNRQAKANSQQALGMSFSYVFFLTLASVLTVAVFAIYIQLQADNHNRMSHIASLEGQVLQLTIDNDAEMKRVESSVSLDEIKKTAMNEMGMVYPSQEQIVYFTVDVEDYMNQYQDIPEK